MLVQSGTARIAMEIIIGNPEWSDYIIEADLLNVGNRFALPLRFICLGSVCIHDALVRRYGNRQLDDGQQGRGAIPV